MKIMMMRGSGCADPGVETVICFFLCRADPGLRIRACRNVIKNFHDDVQIRGYGSKISP